METGECPQYAIELCYRAKTNYVGISKVVSSMVCHIVYLLMNYAYGTIVYRKLSIS